MCWERGFSSLNERHYHIYKDSFGTQLMMRGSYKDNDSKPNSRSGAPAEGERRSSVGYRSQYRVSAFLILRGLHERSFEWIRVADPEAGRVDDLQIGSQSRIDAFQIKWSQYAGSFTLNNLIRGSRDKPPLIAQLADGWLRLRSAYPEARVVVHLITNDHPSVSDEVPANAQRPTPRHFAAFMGQVWGPVKRAPWNSRLSIPRPWQPAWQALQSASGLPAEDFEAFVRDCELEFGYRLVATETAASRDQQVFVEDLRDLAGTLFDIVSDPERVIQLTRDQLLLRLGWKERLAFRSRHEFPEPDIPYHPIEETVDRLENALLNLPGGYVALLGTLGSGKSTLLTQVLRYRPERVIRYYAYIPDAQDPIVLRGESENFLHDVVLAIEQAGFRAGGSPSKFDRSQLLERFHSELQLLHKDWEESGRKTVILIDGLDHIAREQHPNRSLLNDLPLPEQVPEGIYFILGSQTDAPFPDRVQAAVRTSERRIEIGPLSREAVFQIVDQAKLPVKLSPDQKGQVYVLSEGHPLALVYLLNSFREVEDEQEVGTILNTTKPYEGGIESQYYTHWKQVETDQELVHLLALIARLRRSIDLSWIATWFDPAVIDRLRRSASQYFRRESDNRWYFFHNSFRLFLISKTAESTPAAFDTSRDRSFHHELAEICAQASAFPSWAWEELYHRSLAGEHDLVLESASQEWFRNQFFAFRPVDAIQVDIGLALRSAAMLEDAAALTRLVLASAEIAQRGSRLKGSTLVPLLLDVGEDRIALEYVRDGNRLRIDSVSALRISVDLKSVGLIEEARRVFELAEPLDLLSSYMPVANDPKQENDVLLETWAETAIHFRDLGEIVETIHRIHREAYSSSRMDDEASTRSLRYRMLCGVSLELLSEERWEDLETMGESFDIGKADDLRFWFIVLQHAFKHCIVIDDRDKARYFLEELLRIAGDLDLDSEAQVFLAEGVYRILEDEEQAQKWVRDVTQPELKTDIRSNFSLKVFLQRFRLNRLLYALGNQQSPADIIAGSDDPAHQGIVYFERGICLLARIWGEAWRGRKLDKSSVVRQVFPALRLFSRPWQETRDWLSWHSIWAARGEFYELLVDAVAQHGPDAIESLCAAFDREWGDSVPYVWPVSLQRQIIMALWQVGVEKCWVVDRLSKFDDIVLGNETPSDRIDECREQAEAWIELGEEKSARHSLKRMFEASLGLSHEEDYQLDSLIEWLACINQLEPGRASERVVWLARAIASLKDAAEPASRFAASKLLEVT